MLLRLEGENDRKLLLEGVQETPRLRFPGLRAKLRREGKSVVDLIVRLASLGQYKLTSRKHYPTAVLGRMILAMTKTTTPYALPLPLWTPIIVPGQRCETFGLQRQQY